MTRADANFTALMRDASGAVVPGSLRRGHNVMTNNGRDNLTKLAVWGSFGPPDVSISDKRARWIGVGDGSQAESKDVVRLASPIRVILANRWLKEIDHTLTVFPTVTSVTFKVVFDYSELSYAMPVVVSEAGMFLDNSPPVYVNPYYEHNAPDFYKTFEPMVKMPYFTMEILWELKF